MQERKDNTFLHEEPTLLRELEYPPITWQHLSCGCSVEDYIGIQENGGNKYTSCLYPYTHILVCATHTIDEYILLKAGTGRLIHPEFTAEAF